MRGKHRKAKVKRQKAKVKKSRDKTNSKKTIYAHLKKVEKFSGTISNFRCLIK